VLIVDEAQEMLPAVLAELALICPLIQQPAVGRRKEASCFASGYYTAIEGSDKG
jgi:hypothetical protein